MNYAKELLEEITRLVPPGENQHHNLIIDNGELILTLMLGDVYQPVNIDNDIHRHPFEIAIEIHDALKAKNES